MFRAAARPTFAPVGKSGQKRRSNLRFENPLAPRTWYFALLYFSRCYFDANLSKCRIAPAAIPAAAQGAKCRGVQFYISEQKRQRSEKDVNAIFRTNQNAAASGGRKSKNHGFLAAFFPPFLSLLKEMGPPEAGKGSAPRPQARNSSCAAVANKNWGAPVRETAPYSKKETDAGASVSFCISQYASFSARYAFSSPMGTRTCSMVSRSRTVTQLSPAFSASPTVSKSTVMQNGVPTSSSRR